MIDHGKHLLVDFFDVDTKILTDAVLIQKTLVEAASLAGATVLNSFTHKFGGHGGVTSVIALAESHISIHTWPESKIATVDVYMCGHGQPEIAIDYIMQSFTPRDTKITSIIRGQV